MIEQRSLILFHSAIKSEKTRKAYDVYLEGFRKYFIIKNYDSILTIKPKKLQEMIEDYIIYHKSRNKSLSLISGKISALKLFFSMNDIMINWIKMQKMLPEKQKKVGDKPYSTEQIRILLNHTANFEYKALIQFMASSGCRVGCFEELKICNLSDFPNGCKCVKVYADTKDECFTFIHHEAVEALNNYLESRKKKGEKITPDSWVFCSPFDTNKPLPSMTITSTLGRYVKKCIGREKSKNGRYEIMSCHGFRKRFDTILKSNGTINISLAEKLMGHSVTIPLDNNYFKPKLEQMFEEYQKAIPELIIDEKYRLQIELDSKQKKIDELNSKDKKIEELESKMEIMHIFISDLRKDLKK